VRVVALVESEDHVCCRYRLAAFRDAFARAGHALDIHSLPQSTFGRLAIGRGVSDADAVIVQRKLLPRWAVALLRCRVRRLVFDFDDAVWLRDSYAPQGFDDPKRSRRFKAMVAACDLVVAGNAFLAAEAKKHTDPNRVVVIPTCVEPAKYPARVLGNASPSPESRVPRDSTSPQRGEVINRATPSNLTESAITPTSPRRGEVAEACEAREAGEGRPPCHRSHLRLVWVGSQSTLRGLERFAPTLSAIGRAVPGTRLKLVCDQFITIPDLPVDECPWHADTEAAEIATADIGIGWVPDDPWSRGKCGLKLLQYHAAGLPVVANPVGVQAEMVRDGETGYLATTTEEWVAAVARLTDSSLRQRLGLAGRKQVEERYSVASGARAWLAALERVNSEGRRASGAA
jgi:glycosyltransferase involved in cell wall biosynthesis